MFKSDNVICYFKAIRLSKEDFHFLSIMRVADILKRGPRLFYLVAEMYKTDAREKSEAFTSFLK
nr:MAG TPA: hypothetical protein [Caudoviricetes sp.]